MDNQEQVQEQENTNQSIAIPTNYTSMENCSTLSKALAAIGDNTHDGKRLKILCLIAQNPAITRAEICSILGINRVNLHQHEDKLEAGGIIVKDRGEIKINSEIMSQLQELFVWFTLLTGNQVTVDINLPKESLNG